MIQDQYSELMAKYFSGESTEEERIQLMNWVEEKEENKALFEDHQAVWALLESPAEPSFEINVEKAWETVEKTMEPPILELAKSTEKPLWSIRKFVLRVAAVFLLSLIVGYAWMEWQKETPPAMVEIQTGEEEKKEIELPDGSKVWLNENTSIQYAEGFTPRQITLEGEAFFDVEKLDQQSFEIFSGEARTLVLGTAFNVRAYPKESKIEVTVERGKVALDHQGDTRKSVLLTAGNTGVFNKSEQAVRKRKNKGVNAAAWKNRKLEFSNTKMKDVIESLERYFDISINAENPAILNCHFTGQYQNPKIEQIMDIIKFVLNVDIEKEATGFSLSGTGCQDIQ